MQGIIEQFAQSIRSAAEDAAPLCIRAGGSKDFYGGALAGAPLDVSAYAGVIEYEPGELILSARAGTPLAEVESLLAAHGQMLAFEPPHFGTHATLGGCVAAGLSGPRRPCAGAVRDFMLGVRMLDGRGRELRFGGRVMKNVAGYDVSRLMAGAMGTLGVLLDITLKVLPLPERELTLSYEMPESEAIAAMNHWAGRPLPISASSFHDGMLALRLSGAESALAAARARLGGEEMKNGDAFWRALREHEAQFFGTDAPLWRIAMKSSAPPLVLPGAQWLEWGGALRWYAGAADAQQVRGQAAAAGGHATLFRCSEKPVEVFQPLAPALLQVHRRLKRAFDPAGIFNRGRLYAEF
ncbi:MAG: glycolate oxidase subunit GlcE [Pseudomonadota bacterium]